VMRYKMLFEKIYLTSASKLAFVNYN
jgi:hypothetical protein